MRDPQIFKKCANKLDVQETPTIFEGQLQSHQKQELIDLLQLSIEAFGTKFKNESFTRKIYNIFNNGLSKTALNTDLDKPIDSLILNFYEGRNPKSFKLERFDRAKQEDRQPSDMYQISILDLVEFLDGFDLNSIQLKEEDADLRYIELISAVFNAYVEKNASKYIGADFDSAEFAAAPGFELNTAYIRSEKTLSLVQNKVLAGPIKNRTRSFKKKGNQKTGFINADLMGQNNDNVE